MNMKDLPRYNPDSESGFCLDEHGEFLRRADVLGVGMPADADVRAAIEPLTWRWKPKSSTTWFYNPEPEWLDRQSADEIDAEPVYSSALAARMEVALKACRIIDDVVKEGHDNVGDIIMHFMEAVEPARAALTDAANEREGE